MAESDYNVADRDTSAIEAGDKIQETVQATPDADAATFADTNNVSQAAYANYATALGAHAARTDIEGLAERRARENGDAFGDADFMRAEADGVAPTPGTVDGVAPTAS